MDLLRAELNRLRYRRRFMWGLVAVLLASLAAPMLWMDAARPLSPEEFAEARAIIDPSCLDCRLEDFVRPVWTFSEVVSSGITPFVALAAVLTLVLTVVYVGSDFSSGAVGTQLTFTPRRSALVVARCAVSALLGAAVMTLAAVVSTVVSAIWYIALNGYQALDATTMLLGLVLAAVFYGLALGAVGGLLTMLTAGASLAASVLLGVFVADVLALAIGSDIGMPVWLYHLLPTQQGLALLVGTTGTSAGEIFLRIDRAEAVFYHVAVALLIAAVTLPVFERRDIRS